MPNQDVKVIKERFFIINGTDFAFFGWLNPYSSQGATTGNIEAWINGENVSLNPWFNCPENYYECAASYIKYFHLPYLYWQYLFRDIQPQALLHLKYSGELSEVIDFKCNLPYDQTDYGVNVAFSKINETYYYKDTPSVYFSFLPLDPSLIDPTTNLTNTQYYFLDNPKFFVNVNGEKQVNYSFDLLSYPDFYLYKGVPSEGSFTWSQFKGNVVNERIFEGKDLATNSTSRGYFRFHFSFLLSPKGINRFFGIEYQPVVQYKVIEGENTLTGNSKSELKSYYSFIKGPNNVIYLRKIELG